MQVRGPLVGQEQVTPGQQSTGHATSRSGGEGGGQSWRGVVEAAAEMRLINLALNRCLIYSMELEVRQFECMPGCWCKESKAKQVEVVGKVPGRCE